jgi:hypothetical protein
MPYCGITKASKKLPEKCRESFKKLWKEVERMDLYEGDVDLYFKVITSVIQQQKEKIDKLSIKLKEINKIISQ